MRMFGIAVFICAAAVASVNTAQATEFCDIPKTRDGFVALRSGPSATTSIVARMREGDEVLADGGVAPRNGWFRVTWWKGGRFRPDGYAYDKPTGKGWMYGRFMRECG